MNNLGSGHINLFGIYQFVATHARLVAGRGNMKDYTRCVSDLVAKIPRDTPGWYLWGRFNDVGWWETVYLGKAGNKKTSSLNARIKEELLDERVAFWATVYGREPAEKQVKQINKNSQVTRELRKQNSHFIVWLSAPVSEQEISDTERYLISHYRPANNVQRKPFSTQPSFAAEVIRKIDTEIDSIANAEEQRT